MYFFFVVFIMFFGIDWVYDWWFGDGFFGFLGIYGVFKMSFFLLVYLGLIGGKGNCWDNGGLWWGLIMWILGIFNLEFLFVMGVFDICGVKFLIFIWFLFFFFLYILCLLWEVFDKLMVLL